MSKVLIIEDEVSIAELEKDYLELSGFDVEIESDGARGLEKALASDFDIVYLRPDASRAWTDSRSANVFVK